MDKPARLILGNKRYSSWSLRGWLLVRLVGLEVEEIVLPLRRPDSRDLILSYSPSGKVPCLLLADGQVWDSLAIAETLNEGYPQAGLWPKSHGQRLLARSVAAEMHAGFAALRKEMPMDLVDRYQVEPSAQCQADIARIKEIWRHCLTIKDQSGPFLFGPAGAVDAFFAPVVVRFQTYGVPLDSELSAYVQAVRDWPLMQQWAADAAEEDWSIDFGLKPLG